MIAPHDRARLLDAEMQLQRAWLELNLREFAQARHSPWSKISALKLGSLGIALLRYRAVWTLAVTFLLRFLRRNDHKEKS